jgi:DNA-binding MarR family transcriptional regulator
MTDTNHHINELMTALADLKRVMLRSRDQLFGDLQLTRTQIEVLFLLGEHGDQTIGELASCLAVTHSASTQTVETMLNRGLVERTADPADRRIVRVNLSATGKELAGQLHKERLRRLHDAFGGLSKTEMAVMTKVLTRLTAKFTDPVPTKTKEEK